jgi:lantibiotic biosynthesis dehydratase-like protein
LARRAEGMRGAISQLQEEAASSALTRPLSDILIAHAHMSVNRQAVAKGTLQESAIYELLARQYASRLARAAAREGGGPLP